MKSIKLMDNINTKTNVYINTSNGEDLDFENILEECGYTHVLVPCSGILASVKILVSTGLSSAQCDVFIIVDVFIQMFKKKKN